MAFFHLLLLVLALARSEASTTTTSVVMVDYGVVEGTHPWLTRKNETRSILCYEHQGTSCYRETVASNCQGLAAIPVNSNSIERGTWLVKEHPTAIGCSGKMWTFGDVRAFALSPLEDAFFPASVFVDFFATALCDPPPVSVGDHHVSLWTAISRAPTGCLSKVCQGGRCSEEGKTLQFTTKTGACLAFTWSVFCNEDTWVSFETGGGWGGTLQGIAWVKEKNRRMTTEGVYNTESAFV